MCDALEIGYRHIDTAKAYGNEGEVGKGSPHRTSRDGALPDHEAVARGVAPDRVRPSTEGSLERLGADYVDLLLLHWPNEAVPLEETIGALAELSRRG